MSEYADIIIPFLGMITGFLVWMQYRTQVRLKDKDAALETIENKQIKIQSEADNTKAQLDILREMASGTFKSQEQWQSVVNTMSARKHGDDERLAGSLDKLATASVNLTEMLEIHSEQLQQLVTTVQDSDKRSQTTLQAMEQIARDNQSSVTTALGLSVSHRAESDTMLQSILKTINDVARDINSIVTRNEDNRLMTLQGINTKLHSIEANIAALIAPRPAVLADTPVTPQTWNEDTETTAIIPPRKLADEDGNPKPVTPDSEPKPPMVA